LIKRSDLLVRALEESCDPLWRLEDHGYEPALEHEMESRFTVANGFLGVRGSLELPTLASRPRTFIAGLFDRSPLKSAVPSLVSAPDWLNMRILVNGKALSLSEDGAPDHRRVLDFARGILVSTLRQESADGVGVLLRALRFASLRERHLGAQIAVIGVEEPAELQIELGLAGTTVFNIPGQPRSLAIAAECRLQTNRDVLAADESELGQLCWSLDAGPDERARLSRVVAFATASSDDEAAGRAGELARRFRSGPSVLRLYKSHVRAWKQRWAKSDVVVEGDDASQKALRFAIYHLISAANPEDEHVSVGARALSGDGYKGHVFWDTEIFLLPFYTLTWPAAARALLMYRYHTLPAARAKAKKMGFRGALYAWESTDTGAETTPPFALGPHHNVVRILCGAQEHHISADIAYAVWRYWQATGDIRFLLEAGAQILLETSRFWASRARPEDDGRYHIRGVIGPDEYHETIDDNAYTNVMAAFNLECGHSVAKLLERRWPDRWAALKKKLRLSPNELAVWADVQQKLFTGFDAETGLYEQFAGFFGLEEVDLKAYADRTAPIDLLLGAERTTRSQVIKQADVLMLPALLGDRFERRVQEVNFDYYEPRTGHGSSLSPPAHAMVAARLGRLELAKRFFEETAAIDLDDTMGTAAGGVHIGALGGLWQAAVFGFAGLRTETANLRLDPQMPAGWQRLAFPVQWRGRLLRIDIAAGALAVSVTLETGRPLSVYVGGLKRRLRLGEPWRCARDGGGEWREVA
jgi:Trehalose and maltose hydrolases (possible phosphorylases)